MFSPTGKIALKIYEAGDEGMHFSKLVNELLGEVSRMTIVKGIDKLFDMGVLSGKWEYKEISTADGQRKCWVRTFRISGEHAEECIKLLQTFREHARV